MRSLKKKGSLPEKKGSLPEKKGSLPEKKGSLPVKKGSLPAVEMTGAWREKKSGCLGGGEAAA